MDGSRQGEAAGPRGSKGNVTDPEMGDDIHR